MRFLLGFHFGYLGYPTQAVRELDKGVQIEGRDPAARKLHDMFAAKIGAPQVGPVPKSEQPAGAQRLKQANPHSRPPRSRSSGRRTVKLITGLGKLRRKTPSAAAGGVFCPSRSSRRCVNMSHGGDWWGATPKPHGIEQCKPRDCNPWA